MSPNGSMPQPPRGYPSPAQQQQLQQMSQQLPQGYPGGPALLAGQTPGMPPPQLMPSQLQQQPSPHQPLQQHQQLLLEPFPSLDVEEVRRLAKFHGFLEVVHNPAHSVCSFAPADKVRGTSF